MVQETNLFSKTQEVTQAGEAVEQRGLWCTFGGNASWCNHEWKTAQRVLKKLKVDLPYDPTISLFEVKQGS